ncbi:hypothetical protein SteCoe_29400 [Stentor coeruleus]|uniref:Uncharacterized protein n=1 Tax=Stentor coeruleus TaxID=5963 RepID=A0A1R2B6B9_9CILI|nr:hypothetical protein SteCoe_29400 [Stentor coeruleus]
MDTFELNFSQLVIEKNLKKDIIESKSLEAEIEYQRTTLKQWVEQVLINQQYLIQKIRKYKERYINELNRNEKLEDELLKYRERFEKTIFTSSPKSESTIVCSSASTPKNFYVQGLENYEEIKANTNKLVRKIEGNCSFAEVMESKISINKFVKAVKRRNIELVFLKLLQFTCDVLDRISCYN